MIAWRRGTARPSSSSAQPRAATGAGQLQRPPPADFIVLAPGADRPTRVSRVVLPTAGRGTVVLDSVFFTPEGLSPAGVGVLAPRWLAAHRRLTHVAGPAHRRSRDVLTPQHYPLRDDSRRVNWKESSYGGRDAPYDWLIGLAAGALALADAQRTPRRKRIPPSAAAAPDPPGAGQPRIRSRTPGKWHHMDAGRKIQHGPVRNGLIDGA